MDKDRQLVNSYYVEFLNTFLTQLVDKDTLEFLPLSETLSSQIESFKEKADLEGIRIYFRLIEDQLVVDFLHRESHRHCNMTITKHYVMKNEISQYMSFDAPYVLELLNNDVKEIQNRFKEKYYRWKVDMFFKGDKISFTDERPRRIDSLYSNISFLVWKEFESYPVKEILKDNKVNSHLIDNWFNYQNDYDNQDQFRFAKQTDGSWKMTIKDHPDYHVLITVFDENDQDSYD